MANNDIEIEIKGEREITNNTDYTTFFDAKKKIMHYLLTVEQKENDEIPSALVYQAIYYPNEYTDASLNDVIEFCRGKAVNGTDRGGSIFPSPLDMTVASQCWLVIELDKTINWSFARNARACTSKHADPDHGGGKKGHNLWLRHVYKNGDTLEKTTEGDVGKDGCRVLFFGVAHRGYADKGTTPHHYFNLKIEFFQAEEGRLLLLPVVLDPDVGNDGHDEIPPP